MVHVRLKYWRRNVNKRKTRAPAMAHRNVAAAGLIHIRAHWNSYYRGALSLSLFLSLAVSPGVAVRVTSITALNARPVPTSISFCDARKPRSSLLPSSSTRWWYNAPRDRSASNNYTLYSPLTRQVCRAYFVYLSVYVRCSSAASKTQDHGIQSHRIFVQIVTKRIQ